jgi:hypothetical protein
MSGNSKYYTVAFMLFGLFLHATALEFLDPPELRNVTLVAPRNRIFGAADAKFDVTGELALYNETDLTDKIVLYDGTYPNMIEFFAENTAAKAVIMVSGSTPLDIPGISNYIIQYGFFPDFPIPVVQIAGIRWTELTGYLAEGKVVTLRIRDDDLNEWEVMMESGWMIFFSVFMSLFTFVCLGLAVYKFIMFSRTKGCIQKGQLSVTQTMLIFEMCGNSLRFISCAVDSLMSRKLLSFLGSQLLFTTHWPFVIVNLLMVSFYWHELMSKTKVKINRNLSKFNIPFWVIFAVFVALEWAQSVLRGLAYSFNLFLIIVGIAYILIALACITFYYITGVKLQKKLRNSKVEKLSGTRLRRLNRASTLIYASSGGVIVWVIGIIVGGLTNTFWIPWGYFAVWFIIFFSTTFISLMHLLAIQEPRPCGQGTSSTAMSSTGQRSGSVPSNTNSTLD